MSTTSKQPKKSVTSEAAPDQPTQKGLQKLSKPVSDVLADFHEKNPKPGKDATQTQHETYLAKQIKALLEESDMEEWAKEDLRNQTWEHNHRAILYVIDTKIREENRMPGVNELTKMTGLSRQTIIKHLKGFQSTAFYEDHLQQFRLMAGSVLAQVYNLAMQGDVKAARVYLDAVGGLPGLKQPVGQSEKPASNYIQINNNIKIDQPTFTMLPGAVQQQITELVLQGMQSVISQPQTVDISTSTNDADTGPKWTK